MPTIIDVAARAGVSMKTVSRVLNREPHVTPDKQRRVEEAVRALKYQPNQSARRLAGRRSFLITHLYEFSDTAYTGAIQAGATRRCQERGYHLVIEALEPRRSDVAATIERLIATLRPDGILLTPPLADNAEALAAIARLGVRSVQIGSVTHRDGLHVFVQDMAAAQAMTEHLIALGHRRIGFVRGHPDHLGAASRFTGFQTALIDAGLRLPDAFVTQGYFDIQSGIEAARILLSLSDPPTAIFAANDEMALGAMIAARELGIEVPRALSVAGFDDTPMSRLIWPPLTTVHQPLGEIGATAVDMLVSEKSGEIIEEVPFSLRLRTSTAPARPD